MHREFIQLLAKRLVKIRIKLIIQIRFSLEEGEVRGRGHDEGEEGAGGGPYQRHQLAKVWNLN